MDLFAHDYDDLARQVQHGLERVGISFLRGHGARIRRDQVDFHGREYLDLELSHGPHNLKIHQVRSAPPPGSDLSVATPPPLEEFESSFDGWPAADGPDETIGAWLRSLPAGEAAPEPRSTHAEPGNPFAAGPRPERRPEPASEFNPFRGERSAPSGSNPFADDERERRRRDALRRLKSED